MSIVEQLRTIRVLWRQPYVLTLWGIPYTMRPGQQPYDLWKAHRDYLGPRPGHYGAARIDLSDWIALGEPGWWGSRSGADIQAIEAFLAVHRGNIPQNPCEWSELQPEPVVPEGHADELESQSQNG